jgi:hypothetical protein
MTTSTQPTRPPPVPSQYRIEAVRPVVPRTLITPYPATTRIHSHKEGHFTGKAQF